MSGAQIGLAEQQRWLFERVTGAQAAHAGAAAERVLGGKLPAHARLAVYRHAYVARLLECLEDDYPALQHALGHERFGELCRDFIREHPPQAPSLNHYGAPLPGYCAARREPWALFAAELAALEWALVQAIHESDGDQLDRAALARLSAGDWARARLLRSPTARLLETAYPVGRYYQAFREGQLQVGFPAAESSALAICRRGAEVWRMRVEPELLPLLRRLLAGSPLLPALEAAAAEQRGPGQEALQRAFHDWMACGMFSSVLLEQAEGAPAQSPPPPQLEPQLEPLLQLEPQLELELPVSEEKELQDELAWSE